MAKPAKAPRPRRSAARPTSRAAPQRGAGRPRKPPLRPAEDVEAEVAALKVEIANAEADRAAAVEAFRAEPRIANKVALLAAEIRVATGHAALCRAIGNYTHALAFSKAMAKLAGEHAEAFDQQMFDAVPELEAKVQREHEAARAGRRS